MTVAAPNSPLILGVRVGNNTPRVSRLVLDLGPDADASAAMDGANLVITVNGPATQRVRQVLAAPVLMAQLQPQPAPEQRIPRQTPNTEAAAQGILHTPAGLGIGGASITLEPLSGGRPATASTTGDGVFRLRDLAPGRYRLTAVRDGYRTLVREGITIRAGEVFIFDEALQPVPSPDQPSLPEVQLPSVYRNYPLAQTPTGISIGPPAREEIPPADRVFTPIASRWNYDFPDYRRYAPPTLNVENTGGDVQFTRLRTLGGAAVDGALLAQWGAVAGAVLPLPDASRDTVTSWHTAVGSTLSSTVTVADAAVSVAATAVKVTATVVETTVDVAAAGVKAATKDDAPADPAQPAK